jgi:chromosome partitioning protein
LHICIFMHIIENIQSYKMSIFKKRIKPKSKENTGNLSNRKEEEVILSQRDVLGIDLSPDSNKSPAQKPVTGNNSISPNSNFTNYDDLQSGKNPHLGRIIAVANQKGGVGKSTTAVNLSSYLGDSGYKTLIVDFDPQSNSTSGIGLEKDNIRLSIYDVLINNLDPVKAILKTPYKNLYLLPSSIQLAGAEVELVASMKREYKFKHAIDKIKNQFDFIIVDCPPALGLLTVNALTGASEVLIPIQCEYYALEGLGQLMNTISLIKENLNEQLVITGVVMTMYDQRTRLSEQVIEEVRSYFPDKVYKTIIPRNVRLSEAPSYGKPIIYYDPECKGAQAYKSLTKEVIANGPA